MYAMTVRVLFQVRPSQLGSLFKNAASNGLCEATSCRLSPNVVHKRTMVTCALTPLWPSLVKARKFTSQVSTRTNSSKTFESSIDKYNGVHVDLGQISCSTSRDSFRDILKASLSTWQSEDRNSVLMQVPILHSHFIPTAAEVGFEFHHSHQDFSVLKLWLNTERPDLLPMYATHQVGVAGFVLNEEKGEVLVMQDRHRRYTTWKFPGGLSDLDEDIAVTAEREVFEETGIESEFQSVLTFRQQHQHPNAFGRSDIYIVCRMKPLTFDLNPCELEVKDCKWMPLQEVIEHKEIAILTKRVTKMVMYGLEEGFDKIDIRFEEFPAVYSGLFYKLYHRALPENWR